MYLIEFKWPFEVSGPTGARPKYSCVAHEFLFGHFSHSRRGLRTRTYKTGRGGQRKQQQQHHQQKKKKPDERKRRSCDQDVLTRIFIKYFFFLRACPKNGVKTTCSCLPARFSRRFITAARSVHGARPVNKSAYNTHVSRIS